MPRAGSSTNEGRDYVSLEREEARVLSPSPFVRSKAAEVLGLLRQQPHGARSLARKLKVGRSTVHRAVAYLWSIGLDVEASHPGGVYAQYILSTRDRMRIATAGEMRVADVGMRAVCLALEGAA